MGSCSSAMKSVMESVRSWQSHRPSIKIRALGSVPNDDSASRLAITTLTARLASSGCPTRLIEDSATSALDSLGLQGVVVTVMSNTLQFLSTEKSWGCKFPRNLSVNIAERCLGVLLRVGRKKGRYDSNYVDAYSKQIASEGPLYPLWLQGLCWISMQPACALVFFGLSWANALLVFLISLATFFAAAFMPAMWPRFSFTSGFIAGLTSGFIQKAAFSLGFLPRGCIRGVTIASMMAIVPGAGITLGVKDISQGHLVNGSSRLLGALVQAYLQGFGLIMGWDLAAWQQLDPAASAGICPNGASAWWYFLLCPIMWIGWMVLLDAPIRRWHIYSFAALIPQLFAIFLPSYLPQYLPTFLSSLSIGLYAQIYANLSLKPSFGILMVGVYSLLPGGSTVWGVAQVMANVAGSDATTGFIGKIFESALLISAGLGISLWIESIGCFCNRDEADVDQESLFKPFVEARSFRDLLKQTNNSKVVKLRSHSARDLCMVGTRRAVNILMK